MLPADRVDVVLKIVLVRRVRDESWEGSYLRVRWFGVRPKVALCLLPLEAASSSPSDLSTPSYLSLTSDPFFGGSGKGSLFKEVILNWIREPLDGHTEF